VKQKQESSQENKTFASLAKIPFFTELEPSAVELIVEHAVSYEVAAEQVVFLEREPSKGLYVVASGWLKGCKISESGREQVLRYFRAGEVVNEVSLFIETLNQSSLIALEPSTVWLIPRQAVLSLVEEQPKLLWPLTQNLAKRLLYVVSLVEDLSLLPLEARLAKFILEQAKDDVFERRRWATQAELASRLGTVPDVLQRILRSLAEEKLIDVQRDRIVVLNHAGLEAKIHQP